MDYDAPAFVPAGFMSLNHASGHTVRHIVQVNRELQLGARQGN
jgi:hypothetical protein